MGWFCMPGKGNSVTLLEKNLVVNIKRYFDMDRKLRAEYENKDKDIPYQNSVQRTALATNFSEITVRRIMAEFSRNQKLSPPLSKGSNPYAVNENIKTICQDIIRSHNIRREHISLRLLVGILNDEHSIEIARETLRRCLYRWDIIHGSVQRHTALREQDYVVKARREYLIKKKALNKSGRMLVYLDETFINKNYSGSDVSWYCSDWRNNPRLDKSFGPYINKPSGKGERFIILNAITENGWVKGTQLVFQAKKRTGDYHGSMDEKNFIKWFKSQLLPNIDNNSVIIMDNAPYHNVYKEDGVPPLTSRKTELQKWLTNSDIEFNDDFLRIQLIDLIRQHRPVREYKLDYMLQNDSEYKNRNIEILRTPQYHPELQPIEKCWAVMKQYMGQHCDFTLDGLRKNLDSAWKKVTPETMKGIIKKMEYWENYHFEQDSILDSVDDRFGVNIVED